MVTKAECGFRQLMDLERLSERRFRDAGHASYPAARMFGGQLVAQALRAAGGVLGPDARPHSLHAYFLRGVDQSHPVDYDVIVVKPGRMITLCRVDATQGGRVAFTELASFEFGDTAASGPPLAAAPAIDDSKAPPSPDECVADPALGGSPLATFPGTSDFELRFPDPIEGSPRPFHPCWVRSTLDLREDVLLRSCALAFVSDMGALSGCLPPEEAGRAYAGVSLDHDVRFAAFTRLDDWHWFVMHPVAFHGRRGLGRGHIRSGGGHLAAAIAQEGFFAA